MSGFNANDYFVFDKSLSGFQSNPLVKLIIDAGRVALDYYNSGFSVSLKDDNSPLTEADLAVNSLIISFLSRNFPDIPVLSEESKDDLSRLSSNKVWIIDPIDGTKEFVNRNGEFTINLALVVDKKPVLGFVYAPVVHKFYYADNTGSFLLTINNDSVDSINPISISDNSLVESMIIARSRSHASDLLLRFIDNNNFKDVIVAGSSLKGCLVADGSADVYFRLGSIHEWDIAAMHAVLRSAGGIMTDLNGNELVYNNENPVFNGFLASNNKAHGLLLSLLKKELEDDS